ncbi:class E sortase [Streptomyces sp. NPDC018019]|uniref:class E sortase n=1 Tax=Streptomyces sp. NPDC018019 TaxID=3365030 RepID=UPI0037A4BC7F
MPDAGRNAQGPGPGAPETGRDAAPSPARPASPARPVSAGSGSPWFRPRQAPAPAQAQATTAPPQTQSQACPQPQAPAQPRPYGAQPRPDANQPRPDANQLRPDADRPHLDADRPRPYEAQPEPPAYSPAQAAPPLYPPAADPIPGPDPVSSRTLAAEAAETSPAHVPEMVADSVPDDETMALRRAEKDGDHGGPDGVSRETGPSPTTPPATGGRAARRKAAQEAAKRGSRRGRRGSPANAATASDPAAETPSAPMSRLEARRAERARKESPGVIASRALGEVFITLGVLMLLFVTYQLWWTNVLAHQQAGGTASNLEHEWDEGGEDRKPDAFTPGQGFAIMYIPKLDVKVPIAEGISKPAVLDRGMVGHYDKNSVKTAMPWDKQGNFAVAGHRNTHGEPFRYINKLTKGDKIVVETRSTYYTYAMESILPQTSPRNIGVIGPVPKGSGFTGPGRYLTLTTCTPEFTSTYRMIVWGKMVEERPRSKGKPDALVS